MQPGLSGRLKEFGLPQLMMLLDATASQGSLDVETPEGNGSLYLEGGQIVFAQTGSHCGEFAAYQILSWDEGEFRFVSGGPATERNVERSSQGLCLEATRLMDESTSDVIVFAKTLQGDTEDLDSESLRVLSLLKDVNPIVDVSRTCGISRLLAYCYLENLEKAGVAKRRDAEQVDDDESRDQDDERIRVLLVDDSALMRRALTKIYEAEPDIVVAATAENGEEALRLIREVRPDVISLDLYMPVMDGVTTLKHIMLTHPTPTVVVSSSSPDELDITFDSILRFGAIDFLTKPSKTRGAMGEQRERIAERLRKAAAVDLRGLRMFHAGGKPSHRPQPGPCRGVIVASGGTGGCLSFMQLLTNIPVDLPFAVIGLLPFPEEFLRAFVSYLKKQATFDSEVASHGAPIRSGVCYFARQGALPRIKRENGEAVLQLDSEWEVEQNVVFMDVAETFPDAAIGLTISGDDGCDISAGLAAIRTAGGVTFAQLPSTCVAPEQSQRAIDRGLIDRVVVLPHIASELSEVWMTRMRKALSDRNQLQGREEAWSEQAVQ